MKVTDIVEAYSDMGKLSPEQLAKGGRLDPNDSSNFKQVSGRAFYQIVSRLKQNDLARGDAAKGLETLSIYTPSEYNGMKCYIGQNNSSGYAIAHGDELVSVFSTQGSSGNAIMVDAINNGAKRLDCFAIRTESGEIQGGLYTLYTRHGFKIDTSLNSGDPSEPYSIQQGVSSFVDDDGNVHHDDERVVIFMKR